MATSAADSDIFAVVGLGNPGPEYERTRHNAGFWLLDKWLELHASKGDRSGGSWTDAKTAVYQKTKISGKELFLIKPLRFMNRSGEAALPILRYFKIPLSQTLVAYDELDLPPGVARLKMGGSSGGHRGVADFARVAGSEEFFRLRLGIGHPRQGKDGEVKSGSFDVTNWVLGKPTKEESAAIEQALACGAEGVDRWIKEGFQSAQQKLHSISKLG